MLLTNGRLTFGALVDTQTGFVLDHTKRATDRGLTFRQVPRRTDGGHRVEVKGSLHKFFNNGEHNANQFTAADLLLTLDQLVTRYGIDPFNSKINTIEFGVNVVLPFPVAPFLQNLVSYKNKPFTCDTHSKTPYYECRFQRFTVKLYDKGKQRGLDGNLLRFEIKVSKMVYFDGTGVHLNTLADLLNVANYEKLGALLINTFKTILFDDPTINPNDLTARERETYQNGRNPRYWQIPDDLPTVDRSRLWKPLQRDESKYRAILDHYGRSNWQTQTTGLIAETWTQLTAVSDDLLTQMDDYRAAWGDLTKPYFLSPLSEPTPNRETPPPPAQNCPLLTDVANSEKTGKMSTFNPLYSGLETDPTLTPIDTQPDPLAPGNLDTPGAVVCPVTGAVLPTPTGKVKRRFVSAAMLQHDDGLLMQLNARFSQYANGSKEDEFSRAAHNVRNTYHNPRNNLRRKIHRILNRHRGQLSLFPMASVIDLTNDQRAALDFWQDTPYEVR